jgi:peptide/nickel transport system permease protein
LQLPTRPHPLGTDHLGRDVLARLLYGGRFSLALTTVAVMASGLVGTLVGALAGRVGDLADEMMMRVVDLVIAFPAIIVALMIAALMKPGFATLVLAVTLTGWTTFARLARAVTLEVSTQDYILAATALGTPEIRILRKHIIPNITGPILAMSFLRFGHLLLIIAGLSYLGLGAQPPTPDWGAMLAETQPYMQRVPSLILAPGLTIFITALSVSLAGQGMSLMFDPKQRQLT